MPVPFTFAAIRRGFIEGQPFAVGVFVYGVAFGLLALQVRFSLAEAGLMSAVVYSGSAQLAIVNGLPPPGQPLTASVVTAIMSAILLLNARYLLYGAALRPWLGLAPAWQAYPTLAVLGDGNWILSMKRYSEGERDIGYLFGSGFASFLPWVVGTIIGMAGGAFIQNPKALALDFLIIAFSAAMAVGVTKTRGDLALAAVAGAVGIAADRFLPAGWSIVAAGLAGAAFAWFRYGAADKGTA